MEIATNIPYKKKYKEGILVNPLIRDYINDGSNRKSRRLHLNQTPFVGQSKNFHLTVFGIRKYKRIMQIVKDKKTGIIKRIEHYL